MMVTCGADWFTAADNKRSYSVTFDINDLEANIGSDRIASMSFKEKIKALNNLADAYVVGYVAKEGGLSQDVAAKRLAELSV